MVVFVAIFGREDYRGGRNTVTHDCRSNTAGPPPGYYDSAQGKTSADLRAALHSIVHNHHVLPYSGSTHPNTGDAIRLLDEDPANTNNVLAIYSRYSIVKANLGCSSGTWNREHRWCDSYGLNGTLPQYTDLNNLCAEEAVVNSTRGNNYFDVSNPLASGYKAYSNPAAGVTWSRTSLTWEPPNLTKGDCARAMLYMTVRYIGDAGEPRLSLTDSTNPCRSPVVGTGTALVRNWAPLGLEAFRSCPLETCSSAVLVAKSCSWRSPLKNGLSGKTPTGMSIQLG